MALCYMTSGPRCPELYQDTGPSSQSLQRFATSQSWVQASCEGPPALHSEAPI